MIGRLFASAAVGMTLAATALFGPSTASAAAPGYVYAGAVSCPSAAWCMAVGFYNENTVIERPAAFGWNGHAWKSTHPTYSSSATLTELDQVSCASPRQCLAVGESDNRAIAQSWNGTSWRNAHLPAPSGTRTSSALSVSCTAGGTCLVLAYSVSKKEGDGTDYSARWHRGSWSLGRPVARNKTYDDVSLNELTCFTTTKCLAVGAGSAAGHERPISERWNGRAWTVQVAARQKQAVFAGIGCATASDCVAVGDYDFGQGPTGSIGQHWNGHRWSVTPTPNGGTEKFSGLYSASCSGRNRCLAVGSNADKSYAANWNGKTWKLNTVTSRRTWDDLGLGAVSCSPTKKRAACMAVGSYYAGSAGHAVGETWNGRAWTITAFPSP